MNRDEHQQLIIELSVAVDALDRVVERLAQSRSAPLTDEHCAAVLTDETQMDLFVDGPLAF
jgi:hypothetical protein